jgi:serine/threonine protein kinase
MSLGGRAYEILKCLDGGQGKRFKAITRPDNLLWSIHLLDRSEATKHRLKALLRNSEFNTNVPTVIGYYPHADQIALVCKWIRGVSLGTYLDDVQRGSRPGISTHQATRLFRGFVHGLSQLHADKAVVHCDIKPDNVILTAKPQHLVLVDFGSAWILERLAHRDRGDGETPCYTAPEVLGGAQPGFLSDQFSATMIYYEMLTNIMPYDPIGGGAGVAVAGRVPDNSLKPPSRVAPASSKTPRRLWKQIDRIALLGLDFYPDRRFQTTTDWRKALDRLHCMMQAENELNGATKWLVAAIEAGVRLFRR